MSFFKEINRELLLDEKVVDSLADNLQTVRD
jgi:hypothetical protein